MKEKYGIILIDKSTCIVRLYEVNFRSWKLIHYVEFDLQTENTINVEHISKSFIEFISTPQAQHIAEWKICTRNTDKLIINSIRQMTNLPVELLTHAREQELLSKGMFTELW